MAKQGILERLKNGPVLGDGGYLLELEKRGWVRPGPFTPEVAIVYPEALRELHIEFREADVFELLSSYASARRSYDAIVLDPPAFAKSRAHPKA